MLDQPSKSYDEMLIHSFEEQLYFALVKRGRSDDVAYFHIQKNKASLTETKRDLRSQAIELYWPNSAPDITNFEFENKEFTSVKLIRHKCPREHANELKLWQDELSSQEHSYNSAILIKYPLL